MRKFIFILAIITVAAGRLPAAITQVAISSATTNNGSATSLASPAFTDANTNDLVLITCAQGATATRSIFTTPTTTSGLTVAVSTATNNAAPFQNGGAGQWFACTGAGGFTSKTFTCNWSGSPGSGLIVVKTYSGTNCTNATPSAGIGAVKGCNYTAGTTETCGVTTTATNSLVVGGGNDWTNADTLTAGSGQTLTGNFSDVTNTSTEWDEIQNAQTAGSGTLVNMSVSGVGSGDVGNMVTTEILASGGGGAAAAGVDKRSKLTALEAD